MSKKFICLQAMEFGKTGLGNENSALCTNQLRFKDAFMNLFFSY